MNKTLNKWVEGVLMPSTILSIGITMDGKLVWVDGDTIVGEVDDNPTVYGRYQGWEEWRKKPCYETAYKLACSIEEKKMRRATKPVKKIVHLPMQEYKELVKQMGNLMKRINIYEALYAKKAKTEYPEMMTLVNAVKVSNVQCGNDEKYDCFTCTVKRRNNCWKLAKKLQHKQNVINGLPYTRNQLADLRISDLWILASHLKVEVALKGKSYLVAAIHDKQKELGLIKDEYKGIREVANRKKKEGASIKDVVAESLKVVKNQLKKEKRKKRVADITKKIEVVDIKNVMTKEELASKLSKKFNVKIGG